MIGLILLFVSATLVFIAACFIYDSVRSWCHLFWRQDRRANRAFGQERRA